MKNFLGTKKNKNADEIINIYSNIYLINP